jgi:hypothetical protein
MKTLRLRIPAHSTEAESGRSDLTIIDTGDKKIRIALQNALMNIRSVFMAVLFSFRFGLKHS